MKTILFHPERDADAIPQAAAILRRGGLLGIPTETVYGLGADALNETAVRHIFEAKGRPQDNPLIIHVPDASWLERYCREVPETAYRLAERFWPGPLTMILPRREIVPLQTTGGLETVGVRCPDHPVTRAIIEAAGVPVAAPSGNTSGRPSPTTAGHMAEDMDGKIDGIVDGGPCAVGVESTIIDLTMTPPRLLRPGGLPLEALEEVLGTVAVDKAVTGLLKDGEKPRAPGMKYRHYAPKAPVTAVTGDPAHSALVIRGLLREKAGVICFDEFAGYFEGHIVHRLGPFTDKLAQAQRVFDALRTFDGTDVTEIFAQCPDDAGLGLAVGNRLKKAAGFHLINGDVPVVIGITGGTGSGKTSALQALEALGGTVLDCDAVYHQALREDEALRSRIRDAFGEVFRGTELDRQRLGSLVFSDPQALERLNGIIFDYLPGVLRRRMEGKVLVGLDAINLIESGLGELCCRTVAVLAPGEQRVQRIMQRDHIPEEYARLRIQAQKPDSYYREHCTDVLENQEETPEAFREKAEIFFRDLLRQLHQRQSLPLRGNDLVQLHLPPLGNVLPHVADADGVDDVAPQQPQPHKKSTAHVAQRQQVHPHTLPPPKGRQQLLLSGVGQIYRPHSSGGYGRRQHRVCLRLLRRHKGRYPLLRGQQGRRRHREGIPPGAGGAVKAEQHLPRLRQSVQRRKRQHLPAAQGIAAAVIVSHVSLLILRDAPASAARCPPPDRWRRYGSNHMSCTRPCPDTGAGSPPR